LEETSAPAANQADPKPTPPPAASTTASPEPAEVPVSPSTKEPETAPPPDDTKVILEEEPETPSRDEAPKPGPYRLKVPGLKEPGF